MSTQNISTLDILVLCVMMILLPENAINCCLLACCRRSGSQVLSSDGGEPVKLYTGKTRRDWGSSVFFPCQFFACALISEYLEQASCLQALDLYIFERGFRGLINGGAHIPGGLKLHIFFLFMCRWAYNWMGVISVVVAL